MAEEVEIVQLRDDFYRDSFGSLMVIIVGVLIAIVLLVAIPIYFFVNKPPPVTFPVSIEWRVKAPVPLSEAYLSTPDLLQWASEVIPKSFIYDFNDYNDQLKEASQYFTPDGWKVFLDQLNNYANYNTITASKLFVNASIEGAPSILNQGLIAGRYAWWVQIPIKINYAGFNPPPDLTLTLQVLVVRVPTLNNLTGVGINNVIVSKGTGTTSSG